MTHHRETISSDFLYFSPKSMLRYGKGERGPQRGVDGEGERKRERETDRQILMTERKKTGYLPNMP